ncbi:MAG: ribosome biogenesis GTP-binding protein YihA/YsxC [Bacteroidales bacterium]|jgi:GTP-binding protein|nr:ribosome biogenesis GTP-binding protein YihA/YsxC [Bacteroidales bacterium]
MLVRTAEFVKSSASFKACPNPDRPEYAFVGRSNVGKSSLINMLCGNKKLAKISSTPGKTRLINHFSINNSWYLVDLPGYGYAKLPKSMASTFDKTLSGYLTQRDNLFCVFVLIDSRIPPQAIDVNFINRIGQWQIPLALVFTKIDKTAQQQRNSHILEFKTKIMETWEELPPCFCTSIINKSGKAEILEFVEKCNLENNMA